jgi:hypothetical protein
MESILETKAATILDLFVALSRDVVLIHLSAGFCNTVDVGLRGLGPRAAAAQK